MPHVLSTPSLSAVLSRHGRGALNATSSWKSTGRRSSRPAKKRSRGWSQSGKFRVSASIPSPSWRSLWKRAVIEPPAPELLEITAAKRSSSADAISASFPLRECPATTMRSPSASGMVAR